MFGEEWYKQIQEKGSVDWKKYSENLYEAWLERLQFGAAVQVGHRYWCLWILAAWAWNCKIPYARLQRDAYSLIEQFDNIPNDDNQHVPFTIRDCNAALSIYREHKARPGAWKPIRLSRAKTVRITGINIEPAKRNYRKKIEHLRIMREQYNALHDETRGGDGEETRGRKSKVHLIRQWQEEHPGIENKSLCSKELGKDIKTVRRWWVLKEERTAAVIDEGSKYMFKQVSALIDEPKPKEGDEERLDALFKRLIDELPPQIDREDFVRQMISRMPDYFAMRQAEKDKSVE